MSQPALSMQIHQLEGHLGGELVERRQGDVVLTERGLQVAERAAFILSATRDLEEFAHEDGRLFVGPLRLGIIPTLAPYVLPLVVPQLMRDHPGLGLILTEATSKALLAELTRGTIDVALLALPMAASDVETLHLFEDRFLLAVPASDPLPERARVTIAEADQRNLLLQEECHISSEEPKACYGGMTGGANTGFLATSLATIIQMVANGYGSTLLPEVAVDVEVRDSRVKLLRFSEPQPKRSVGLSWRRTSSRKANFQALGRIIVEALGPSRPKFGGARPALADVRPLSEPPTVLAS